MAIASTSRCIVNFLVLSAIILGSGDWTRSANVRPPDAEADTGDESTKGQVKEDGLPELSYHQQQLLNALIGGLGPVILPGESTQKNSANASPDNPRSHHVVMRREPNDGPRPVPEQIHISYGDRPSEMVIMWSTPSNGSSEVVYGLAPNNFSLTASGASEELVDWVERYEGAPFLHRVKLEDLMPGAAYSYRVKTDGVHSRPYTFSVMKSGTDWSPTLLVYGDMGRKGGAPSLRLLRRAARQRSADAIIHVGDFAYDLHTEGGKVGDDFMNRIQDVAAVLPYMTCVGNHEIPHFFVHYRYRFSMPGQPWPATYDMWYSFNMGKIHFISYSTEVYFTSGNIQGQYQWLLGDLQKANDERDQQPWVIAFGHRPMYCSNVDGDDCTRNDSRVRAGLEELFYDQGVDVIIEAHEHSYERFWPMHRGHVTAKHYRNPVAPVHIISGSAGCDEFNGICVNPMFGPKGEWSAFRSWLPGLYGIGRLHVANDTHLHWQQRLAVNNEVEDEFWIEQNNHGHFPPRV